MSIRQNFLETFVFKDKQAFSELLISDLDAEIEILYKSIANTKETASRYSISLENLRPFLGEPGAYRKKQLEISKKDLKKSKDLLQKNADLLKIVKVKLESIKKSQEELDSYSYLSLQRALTSYKILLVGREKELGINISTIEQDINIISKFDEKSQAADLDAKILINQKMLDKEQLLVQDIKNNIKSLQKLQAWIRKNF